MSIVSAPQPDHDTRAFWIDQIIAGAILVYGLEITRDHLVAGVIVSTLGLAWLVYLRAERKPMTPQIRTPNILAVAILFLATLVMGYDILDRHFPQTRPIISSPPPQLSDPRDMSVNDERKFIKALAQSKSPGQHFHIFCVSDESCRIATEYRDRLYRAGWKNLLAVDPIAKDRISILTFTEGNDMPTQVSDLTQAFAATSVRLNWVNGSGAAGETIGSTGPLDEQTRTTAKQRPPPLLLKGPEDFALIVGPPSDNENCH